MNRWKQVWNNRPDSIEISGDVFETYVQLKKSDGFDIQTGEGYYEGLFDQWKEMAAILERKTGGKPSGVYEVCCGSGADLWLFDRILGVRDTAGLDYSEPLIKIAGSVLNGADLKAVEALALDTKKRYDWVISDSGFQYFPDAEYGYRVFEKMLKKARRAVAVTEIHDLDLKEEHLDFRRSRVKDYDKVYEGLEKTYYDRKRFIELAAKEGYETEVVKPDNEAYWNNRFVFDLYCWR